VVYLLRRTTIRHFLRSIGEVNPHDVNRRASSKGLSAVKARAATPNVRPSWVAG
jgi:hypothetical protein